MRCPACATDNPAEVPTCGHCGEKLARPSRRRTPAFNDKYSLLASRVPTNRMAVLAYRCAVYGLIPGLGLLLGPLAIVLGFLGYRRFTADPHSRGGGHAVFAMIFGALELLSNTVGLVFIWIGLQALAG